MARVLGLAVLPVDRLLLAELLDCLRAHERYHVALDATLAIRDDHPIVRCPLTLETTRLREAVEHVLEIVV